MTWNDFMLRVPSIGRPCGPTRLLVSILLSMAVCLPLMADGPSLFASGTTGTLQVRIATTLDTAKNRAGDRFTATLDRGIERDGRVLISPGATVRGIIRSVTHSGHVSARAAIILELESVELEGRTLSIETDPEIRMGPRHRGHNSKYAGAGMATGMIIGGIATGGAGFVLGALVGGAAGLGAAAATGREDVRIPAETIMIFHVRNATDSRTLATRPGSTL